MPRRTRLVSIALGAVLLTGIPVALSGCSIAEGIIEQQTGGDVDLPGQSVPADFPSDVPLVDGTVTFGAAIGTDSQKAWNVTYTVPGADNPAQGIADQLAAAGFTAQELGGGVTTDGGLLNYSSDAWLVVVIVGKDGDAWTASYTVTQNTTP